MGLRSIQSGAGWGDFDAAIGCKAAAYRAMQTVPELQCRRWLHARLTFRFRVQQFATKA
jgi:hypothetical protein